MKTVARILVLAFAWLCVGAAFVGIFVPVLPTTPLLLLATFLFGKFSIAAFTIAFAFSPAV